MSAISSVSTSAYDVLQSGSNSLEQAAADFNASNPWLVPEDPAAVATDPPPSPDSIDSTDTSAQPIDPLTAGVSDLMLARLQFGAGCLVMQADAQHRQQIFNLLNQESGP